MNTTNILPILGKRKPALASEEPSKAEFQFQYLRTPSYSAPLAREMNSPGEFELKYTNVMLTRQATKKNVVIAGPPRVQFCPFDDVVQELGRFVHLARVGISWSGSGFFWTYECMLVAMAQKLAAEPVCVCGVDPLDHRNYPSIRGKFPFSPFPF